MGPAICSKFYSLVSASNQAHDSLSVSLHKNQEESVFFSKESQVQTQMSELQILIKRTESNGERATEEATYNFEKLFNILEERKTFVLNLYRIASLLD